MATLSNEMSPPRWNEESDDGELVAAFRSGDMDAFERLVLRHQKAMLNLAYRMVGNYEEACEVVQDSFLAAHRSIASFRGEARFSTWLTTITLNHARNRIASLAARRRHEAYSLDAVREGEDDPPPEPPSPAPSALDRLEAQDVRRRIERCLDTLPPDFREVLVLRDLQELAYEEIGTLLRLQAGTVKSRLFRAREGIKDCLKRAMGVP